MLNISDNLEEAEEIAYSPSFGYNGYYIGGMWQMDASVGAPRFQFYDHCRIGTHVPLAIPTKVSQIRRSTEVITFCSTTLVEQAGPVGRLTDDRDGSHLAVPPWLGEQRQWGMSVDPGGATQGLMTFVNSTHVPIGRHTNASVVLYADGHIENQTIQGLLDLHHWIDAAVRSPGEPEYRHAPCPPPPP
jgi:prepilin-type processing-associated H-X9-DG protein